ncbi:MAG: hypothetical protein H3C47_02490 [Candidatus Cloacimonetes bacterium]|nr:hypothetical protein [Candidatus Cloacimonadota bacterium]
MIKQINALREHELARQEARIRVEKARQRIQEAQSKVNGLSQGIEDCQKKIQSKNLEQKRLELDLKALDQELKRLEQQKLGAGSEKLLEALNLKGEKLKESSSSLEDTILEILQSVEDLQTRMQEMSLSLKKEEALFESGIVGWNEELLEAQKTLHEITQEDEQALDGLSADMVRLHTAAHKALKRECVIFAVTSECCPNCGIHLAQNSYIAMRYHNQVHPCPSCQGILYYPG